MKLRTVKGGLFILSSILAMSFAHGEEIVLMDFDNTIVDTRHMTNGSFQSLIRLFRISDRTNTFQSIPEGPMVVEVTQAEYEKMERYLATAPNRPGAIGRTVQLSNGSSINPGEYYFSIPDSLEDFNEAPAGENRLLRAFQEAERTDLDRVRGPFWDNMVRMLSNAETANQFGINTARRHSIQEWREFFTYLRRQGIIQHLPNFNLIYNVMRPEYDRFGTGVEHRKVEIMRRLVLELARKPLTESDLRVSPSGRGQERLHSLTFGDDQQSTIQLAERVLHDLVMRGLPVKITIHNYGTETEVRASGRPRIYVLQPTGFFRRARPEEIAGAAPEGRACRNQFKAGEDE